MTRIASACGCKSNRVTSVNVSIIIPTHNGKKWLEISLPSLAKQDYKGSYEVILIENASSDGSWEYVARNFPEVKLRRIRENLGYAEGCNEGIRHAQGRYIIVLNNDVEMDGGWLSALVKAADEHREYHFLVSVDRNQIKRDFNSYLEVASASIASDVGVIAQSLFASGACFLVRQEWMERLGRLFESYFYYEDAELSLRSVLAGANIGYVASSRYQHFSELERSIRTPEAYWKKQLNHARFSSRTKMKAIYTLFSSRSFLKLLVVHILYLAILCLSRRDRQRLNFEMIRGTFEGISEIGECVGKRSEFQKNKKRPDSYVFQRLLYNRTSIAQRFAKRFLLG